MKHITNFALFICCLIVSTFSFATTSSCYEYYVGSTPYIAHQSSYSSSDAALGPTFGMKTEVTSPVLPEINNYWPTNSGGGSQTIADTPYYAGYWAWQGAAATGTYDAPTFYYQVSTLTTCSDSQTYGPPTSVFVDISPNAVYIGQTAYFSWGASGVVDQCTIGGSPLSPTQGSNIPIIAALSDAGTYTVYCSNYWGQSTSPGQDTLQVLAPTVDITSANLPSNSIGIQLTPSSTTGTLTINLTGSSGNHQVYSGTLSGGSHSLSFGALSSIPQDQYTQIQATWAVTTNPTDSYTYNFRALGTYRHTQYNSPSESDCSVGSATYTITDNSCNTSSGTLRPSFRNAVNLNGSGHSISYNDIGREFFCSNPNLNVFRGNHTIVGAHGPVSNSTVAVNPTHPYINPGNSVYIDSVGTKSVTDDCPVCATAQLDNYTTSTACSDVPDLGFFATFLLN